MDLSKAERREDANYSILIVDDHPLVRQGLIIMLDSEAGLRVCAQTGRVDEALALAREHSPHLAIVDLSLEDGNGLALIRRLHQDHPEMCILVCSMHDEALFAYRALEAGAMGYIGKEEATTQIMDAVWHVLRGGMWLNAELLERFQEGATGGARQAPVGSLETLSNRELEIFDLIGGGLGPSSIAERLHLSVKTVEAHRENIKKKLGLSSGAELLRRALQWTLEQR